MLIRLLSPRACRAFFPCARPSSVSLSLLALLRTTAVGIDACFDALLESLEIFGNL